MIYKMIQKFAMAKPTTTVKTVTPVKRPLGSAPEDKAFFVHGGGVLRNLKDLHSALQSMKKETFAYHVNRERNDFATWIHDVLADKELARRLRQMKTRGSSLNAVAKYLRDVYSL